MIGFPILVVVFFLLFWPLFIVVGNSFYDINYAIYEKMILSESVYPGVIVAWAVFSLVLPVLICVRHMRKSHGKLIADSTTKLVGTPGTNYNCALCGYRWHLDPGQPDPPGHVNPALIAAGEERLEGQRRQAEAERQRQLEEAAKTEAERKRNLEAAHWNYWNNPDNPWNNPDNTSN